MFSYIAYVQTTGDTLNVRSEPNGSVLSTFDNGSIVATQIRRVNAGGHDWIPVWSEGVGGWVAAEFIVWATVLYQVERIIDPSVPDSRSVGTTAFKIELADKTLKKFIEHRISPRSHHEEFSHLSDTDLVQQAIGSFDKSWEIFKGRPLP